MRAIQFDAYGPPEVLHVAEVERPVPGPGQLLLKVVAAGVNPADHKWRSGFLHFMMPLTFPHIVGYDVAGTVAALGPDVGGFRPGDRIVASVNAGYAEYAVADASACALLPADFPFDQAAAFPCPALTGVQVIERGMRPEKGQRVLITGATGGVGRFAVQAALGLGAHVTAAVRPAYFDLARAFGAHEVVSIEDDGNGGFRFDHAADTIGGPAATRWCRHVAPGGKILTVANAPLDEAVLASPVEFFTYRHDGARLARIVESVASGAMPMPVARRLPFEQAAEAHRLMEAGGIGGRIILAP